MSCREKRLRWGWGWFSEDQGLPCYTVHMNAGVEGRDLWKVKGQSRGQGARAGRKASRSAASASCWDLPCCCCVTSGCLVPSLCFTSLLIKGDVPIPEIQRGRD